MKQLLLPLALAIPLFAAFAQVNPVMEKYADSISFYVNFDDDTVNPAMAGGEKILKMPPKDTGFAPGLFGKGLRFGRASYHCPGNMDFSKPGTLVYWMSPAADWPAEGKYPYLFPLIAFPGGGSKIVQGRQNGDYGKTRVYVNVETPDRKDWISNGISGGSGPEWTKGSWHMITFTWTPQSVGISIDGKPVHETTLKHPLANSEGDWFMFTTQFKDEGEHQTMIDEIMIFNRKLTDEELKNLYEETMKKVKK